MARRRKNGTTQLSLRLKDDVLERIDEWLTRTARTAFGARGAELERMIEEGIKRRERALQRGDEGGAK